MDDSPTEQVEREHFFGAAKLVAALTMGSRVLGMVRDMAIWAFGATRMTDAFWMAFSIPNLFRRLFGEGALSAAFVPVFTEVAEAQGWDKARRVLANTAGVLAVVLAGLLVIGQVVLGLWLWLGGPTADWQLLLQLTMIMLPFMFTVCLLALGSAALNCKGHFAYPAFAPILLNVFLIAAAFLAHRFLGGGDWQGLFALSVAVIAAGIVQLVAVVWLLRSVRLAALPRLRPMQPAVRRIAKLVLPMMLPLGLLQFSAFFDRFYAWAMSATTAAPTLELFGLSVAKPLSEGVVTCLYAANRLYQFPLGILAISVATVVFPLFSRYASRGDLAMLRQATGRALRLSLFLGIPTGVGLMLLARPAVILICAQGQFVRTPGAVDQTVGILRMYCVGMWAYFCIHILLRAFFAQKDASTPLRIAAPMAIINVLLVVVGVFTPLRARAIGLASAVTAGANVLLLTRALRRRWGRLGLAAILKSLVRTAGATVCMAAAVIAVANWLQPPAGDTSKLAAGWLLAAAIPAGVAAFAAAAHLLHCQELGELLRREKKTTAPGQRR